MKVLWITNILFPEALSMITSTSELKSTGGWLLGAANGILKFKDLELYVATVSPLVKKLTKIVGKSIVYYILPIGKGNQKINNEYIQLWKEVHADCQPNIVHIHGTEYSHGLAFIRAGLNTNIVISIQGLTSVYERYYTTGISYTDDLKNWTLREFLKGGIYAGKRSFRCRGQYEREMILSVDSVIGRTSWDRAHIWAINPNAKYYFCNETLRDEFYESDKWTYSNCSKHTIFLSQASYPIKGLHFLLYALPLILRHFPDTTVRIAGTDITSCRSLRDLTSYSSYGRYIKRLICKLGLSGVVTFIGNLNASEMKKEYLNSNVFVCPSTIENSPNSLGEAQILGVPCVASYVGGISDMMQGNEINLYRLEEIEMLAMRICEIFSNPVDINGMVGKAIIRHDRNINSATLLDIYNDIMIRNK